MKHLSDFNKFNEKKKNKKPCWPGYTMVGMKEKDDQTVPNCFPNKKGKIKEPKKKNEAQEIPFDIDFFMSKIKSEFPSNKVEEILDQEIEQWVEKDSYSENNNGEAEEAVIHTMLLWYSKTFKVDMNGLEENPEVIDEIKKSYPILNAAFSKQ
jgi:hypothetical protein